MIAISAQRLNKVYANGVHAVHDLVLEVEQGTIFGYLGPNGSGKTTTVRLLNGTLTPTGGASSILGRTSDQDEVRQITSTVAELARMYDQLTVSDNLRFFARLYGLSHGAAEAKVEKLLTTLELWDKRDLRLGSFSTGMQKRVFLARALLNEPAVLFLDEPTSGLDPDSALQVTELIRRLATERGTTVFLCTHNLPLAERICDRFGFMHEGRLVACGTKEELGAAIFDQKRLLVRTDRGEHSTTFERENEINGLVRAFMDGGENLREVRILRPDLEALYFHYIKRNHDERAAR